MENLYEKSCWYEGLGWFAFWVITGANIVILWGALTNTICESQALRYLTITLYVSSIMMVTALYRVQTRNILIEAWLGFPDGLRLVTGNVTLATGALFTIGLACMYLTPFAILVVTARIRGANLDTGQFGDGALRAIAVLLPVLFGPASELFKKLLGR